ncbi:hypothetical protein Rhopal_004360-T1 [Rhodotorula paludigena]|uniref:Proteophosphoglycan 5 n=1 Tax=Rhodotorula paludigena TaxID=86838 RepID=A0AAV5GQ11_9BASI|nr:hypothetical protein Rhopal_004360-T1 [Rhodotorula paludigena]
MSAPLICTALLFRAIAWYQNRHAHAGPLDEDPRSPSAPAPQPPVAATPAPSPAPRRHTSKASNPAVSPAKELATFPFPAAADFPSPPSPRASLPVPSPQSTPTSARPLRRAPSITSRRSSISSSIASTGFHPAASSAVGPVLNVSHDDNDIPHASPTPSPPNRRAESASVGLGRPSGAPVSRVTTPSASTASISSSTSSLDTTVAPEVAKPKRKFSLGFGRRKASQQAAVEAEGRDPAPSRIPVVERLRSFGTKK